MNGLMGRTQRMVWIAAACLMFSFGACSVASACSVYLSGAIGVKWTSLGGNSSIEGGCVDNEHDDGVGNGGWIETFQGGHIAYPGYGPAYAVQTTHGIDQSWMSRGGPAGYGQAISDEEGLIFSLSQFDPCVECTMTEFFIQSANEKTYLVWNPGQSGAGCNIYDNHVCAVYGAIGQWWSVNSESDLSAPVDEEVWDGIFRVQHFQHGYMIWNSQTGNVCAYWNSGVLLDGMNPSACTGGA